MTRSIGSKEKTTTNMCKFRTLRADEIEVRVQSVKDGKARHLLYIDSRAVTNLLDETVGSFNWQSEFYEVNGQTLCRIGIWDEKKGLFIYKSDTGSESNIEGEKGLISDCYKRCLSRWGVTELYSAPKIEMPDDKYGNSGYTVSEITINEQRQITHLVLVNRFGKEAFRWDKGKVAQKTAPQPQPAQLTAQPRKVINANTLANPEQCNKMLKLLEEEMRKAEASVRDFSPVLTLKDLGFEIEPGIGEKVANLWFTYSLTIQ